MFESVRIKCACGFSDEVELNTSLDNKVGCPKCNRVILVAAKVPAVTTGVAAKMLRMSQQHVIRMIDRGLLKGYRIPYSTHRRVMVSDLVEFASRHGVPLVVA